MACEKQRGGNESSYSQNCTPSNMEYVAEQREPLQSPLRITIALMVTAVAVVVGNAVTSTTAEAVIGAAAGAAAGAAGAGIFRSLWEAETRRVAVTVMAITGGLAGTAAAILQSLFGVHSLTGSAITGAFAGAAIVVIARTQLQLAINPVQWIIANLQWVIGLVKRATPALPAATRTEGSGLATSEASAGSRVNGSQQKWQSPAQSAVMTEFSKTDEPFKNKSPKTDDTLKIDSPSDTEELPKTDRSLKTDENLKTDTPPKTEESPKKDGTLKIDKSPKTKKSSKIEESPKTDKSQKTEESPKTDGNLKTDTLPKTGESPKTMKSLQKEKPLQSNESSQTEEPLQTSQMSVAQLETGQEKASRHCQSADNDSLKMSRENTSSKNMGPDLSRAKDSSVADDIKNIWSTEIKGGNNENLPIFTLKLNKTGKNRDEICRRSTFGKNSSKENKTIMMIGATGAGKTTLINSLINYILGVSWKDDFRFVLVDEGKEKSQAESQTSEITAYQINHMDGFRVPYSLTLVDTPGFGDTRGISHDQKITKQIQEFFSAPGGIDRIDAVCFVVQASLARLTHTQKYVFDSILSIFGKDIAQNILVLVTFADGNTPPVLEAIKVAGVPCSTDESGVPLHFKFNNSALFATNKTSPNGEESDCENFDQMFWKLGFSSMKKFFTSLNTMKTQSLSLTQEVLKERQQLEVYVQGLQPQIKAGLTKLDEIKKTRSTLEQHKAEMDANKDFEYEIEVTVPKEIKNDSGHYLTNCQKCYYTCHYPCAFADDRDKDKCCAMKDGKCTVCPGKCPWNVHFNQAYRWDYIQEKRKETYQDLKKRFEDAHGQVMSKEKIFEELENELQVVQEVVAKLIESSQKSLERLQEIALKPNPLSTPDYIDLMIESEKQEAKPGFKDRIQSLMEVRKKAEIISKISTGELLPDDLTNYKPETKMGVFKTIANFFRKS